MFSAERNDKVSRKQAIFKEIIRDIRKMDYNLTLKDVVDKAFSSASGKKDGYTLTELYKFYTDGYKSRDGLPDAEENRGLKRIPQKSSFTFVKPYKMATFTSYYLENDVPTSMFLKSISVSLRLTHEEADGLLRAYGHLPFYSKNIFDLSIYSVLMMNTDPTVKFNRSIDLFKMVEDRYAGAIKIIESETKKGDLRDLSDITTEPIHTSRFLRETADAVYLKDEQKFFAFVKENASYFSIRHGTIIREHGKLIKALGGLYGSDTDGGLPEDNLERYSLRSLIEKFVDYKGTHYNRDVITLAQKGDSNGFYIPTRELMILLWLYAETFVYDKDIGERIPCTAKCVKDIKNSFTEEDPAKRRQIYKKFFNNNSFNVREYLFREYKKGISRWNGEDVRRRLNEKLSKFGWGMLSDNNKFDLVINKLLSFSINSDGKVLYSSGLTCDLPFEFRSIPVPHPLQLIFGILNEITSQSYRASSDSLRKIKLLYSCFDRLDKGDRESMRNEHSDIYCALSRREYTAVSDGREYASLDNDALYALIDSASPLLGVTLTPEELGSALGKASLKKERSISAKELIKQMMFFPLGSGTYEKV